MAAPTSRRPVVRSVADDDVVICTCDLSYRFAAREGYVYSRNSDVVKRNGAWFRKPTPREKVHAPRGCNV